MRLAACLVFVAVSAAWAADARPDEAQRKWVRGIADEFWEGVLEGEFDQAAGLLSDAYSRALAGRESSGTWQGPGRGLYNLFTGPNWLRGWLSVRVRSEAWAPDGGEVVFRGILRGLDRPTKLFVSSEEYRKQKPDIQAEFTMRVAKEGAGRWSIRSLKLKEPKKIP